MVGGAAFSVAAFVFMFGFFDGFFEQLVDNSTRYLTGHAQLERAGFRKDLAPELALDDAQALADKLRRTPGVAAAARRVQTQALISSATKSEGIVLIGIDPVPEREVTFIHKTIVDGKPIEPGDNRDIMIGRKLAQKLNVKRGEKIVVMAQAADGELATSAYRIGGIFATESSNFDNTIAFITLPAAQALLSLSSRVSTINMRVTDRSGLDGVLAGLRQIVRDPKLNFAPWQELLPQLDEMMQFNHVISNIILAVFLLVIATAVMNTVFMAVAERTREFGVMMALGTPPAAIRRMVVYETLVLMLLAMLIGYVTGIALVAYLGRYGIDLSGFFQGYSAIPGLTGIVYPQLFMRTVIPPGIALLVLSVVVSIYPAAKAARLDPVTAIRHA